MGRFRAIPLMMSLLLLAGCAGGGEGSEEDVALAIRRNFLDMTGCTGRLSITADYEARTFDCVLDVVYDTVGGATVTVVEPELVAGVSAHLAPEGSTLTYDTVSLETGPVTDEGLSPMETPVTLYRAVTEGYLAAWDMDETGVYLTYRDGTSEPGQGLETAVTFDKATLYPTAFSLSWDGKQVISGKFESFTMAIGET